SIRSRPPLARRDHTTHPPTQDGRLMVPLRRFGLLDLLSLLLVLAVAAGLRTGYLVRCCDRAASAGPLRVLDARPPLPPSEDDPDGTPRDELQSLIENVRDKGRFAVRAPLAQEEERTAHVAPAFPWLTGHLGKVVPQTRLGEWVRWIHVGLGTLT